MYDDVFDARITSLKHQYPVKGFAKTIGIWNKVPFCPVPLSRVFSRENTEQPGWYSRSVAPSFLIGKHGTDLSNGRIWDGIVYVPFVVVVVFFLTGRHGTTGTGQPFRCPMFSNGKTQDRLI